jgi:hypothetical protein
MGTKLVRASRENELITKSARLLEENASREGVFSAIHRELRKSHLNIVFRKLGGAKASRTSGFVLKDVEPQNRS